MIWILATGLLGGLLLLAGVPKLRDRAGMLVAVQGYRLLPTRAERLVAAGLPLVEVALGGLLVLGIGGPLVPAAAALLFLTFSGALAVNLARGRRDLDCGCFTFVQPEGSVPHISWFHAGRALVLAAVAAAVAVAPGEHGLGVTPVAEHLLGTALAVLGLTVAVAVVVVQKVLHPGRRTVDDHLAQARDELALGPSAR